MVARATRVGNLAFDKAVMMAPFLENREVVLGFQSTPEVDKLFQFKIPGYRFGELKVDDDGLCVRVRRT